MPAHAEDRPYGVLADVVVDQFSRQVTHVVVDPGGDHQQLRLVPVWLVRVVDGVLQIALPAGHVRQLQRALDSDYVRIPAKHVKGAELLRFKNVLALPHYRDPLITGGLDPAEAVPVRSCEIRRSSWVVDRAAHVVGTVAGLLVEDELVHAVIVKTGVVGNREHIAVPMSAIESVGSHFVGLRSSGAEFRRFPTTEVVPNPTMHFRPRELWREVLGLPTNKLWDDFEIDQRG